MLSPEERQRIEEEERKRIAEEQYRSEVRSKLQAESAPVKSRSRLPWIICIGTVLIAGAILYSNGSNRLKTGDDGAPVAQAALKLAPVRRTRYVPQSQKIATGQIIVKASGYVQYRLTVTPEMVAPTVTGNFNASGGSGNDIQVVIANEMNYTNWINGHQTHVLWGTEGKQTTGKFEVTLAPGTYYLVFSNRFSAFTNKQIFLDVDLNYKKAETYYE